MSLKNLINLQKAKGPNNAAAAQATESKDSNADDGQQFARPDAVADGAESVSQQPAPAPEAPKQAGLGLNFLKAGGGGSIARPPAAPRTPAVAASDDSSASQSRVLDGADFDLADLAGLEASDETVAEVGTRSGFVDEIEATAPDRDLPADITCQQAAFVEQVDGMYQVLNDPEMFGQAVRIIMMELQENPEYKKLVCDSDVHTMILGMRNTMGLARIRKQEKSRKAGTTTKKGARKTSGVSDAAMAALDALMGGSDDD